MKFVIQRVQHASVTVDNEVIGKIGKGFLVLIGVSEEDNTEIADKMIKKQIIIQKASVLLVLFSLKPLSCLVFPNFFRQQQPL